MKYYLLVDNFRGFTNTCIALKQVNFLVGENSTGKTSVLGLLKMLSGGPGFLFDAELSDEDLAFRHFSDMVSAHSKDQSYFRVGVVWEEPQPRSSKKTPVTSAWLFTYVAGEGLPRLSKLTFSRGLETITLWREEAAYFFKSEKSLNPKTAEKVVSTMRSKWVLEHAKKTKKGYRKFVGPPGLSEPPPF